MDSLPDTYATHTINILRVAAGLREEAISVLTDLEGELISKAANATTTSQKARLNALLTQTQGSISAAYTVMQKNHLTGLRGLARLEGIHTKQALGKAIGADVFTVATSANQLAAVADAAVVMGHSSAAWWGQQANAMQFSFAGQMRRGILSGEDTDTIISRIRGTKANGYTDGLMNVPRRQAEALVRSSAISTTNAARIKTLEGMDDVVKGIQWLSTLDGRTTQICMGLSGKIWRLPDYAPIGHDKAWPGVTAHWQCVSEGQEADTHGQPILRGYSRDYVGAFVTIETASGHKLTVTPNHPILTAQGFVPAGDIREGGNVVSDFVPCEKAIAGTGEFDAKQRPALIEEITGSLQESGQFITVSVVVAGVDFHGDGMDGEVAIVSSHRNLLTKIQASFQEQAMNPGFLRTNEIDTGGTILGGCPPLGLSAFGSGLPGVAHGLALPTDRMPRRPDPSVEAMGIAFDTCADITPPFPGHISSHSSSPHLGGVAGTPTGSHPGSFNALPYPVLSQAELAHQILDGSLGQIHFDQIISIRKWEGRRRVHNLETTRNFYSAQGIVTGNCRSTQIPVLNRWEEMSGKKLPSLANEDIEERMKKKLAAMGMDPAQIAKAKTNAKAFMDGQVPATMHFEDWLKTKSDDFIDRTLGPGRAKLWNRGNGAISISDLTNQDNRPLTLAQLADLIENGTPAPETQGIPYRPMARPEKARSVSLPTTPRETQIEELAQIFGRGKLPSDKKLKMVNATLTPAEQGRLKERITEVKNQATPAMTPDQMIEAALTDIIPARRAPVSASLQITLDGRQATQANHAVRQIDKVMDDGGLSPIKIEALEKPKDYDSGEYNFDSKTFTARNIAVNTARSDTALTTVHEIGHWLDNIALGSHGVGFASEQEAAFAGLRKAFDDSSAVKVLRARLKTAIPGKVKNHLKYMEEGREIFARAFTQYIVEKSGDPLLAMQLAADFTGDISQYSYWKNDDFRAIVASFDGIFKSKNFL